MFPPFPHASPRVGSPNPYLVIEKVNCVLVELERERLEERDVVGQDLLVGKVKLVANDLVDVVVRQQVVWPHSVGWGRPPYTHAGQSHPSARGRRGLGARPARTDRRLGLDVFEQD